MKHLLILLSFLFAFKGYAQLYGKKDISIQVGFMNFHAKSLNNSVNSNNKLSRVTELDKNIYIGKMASLNTGLGFGTLQNLDNRFTPNENSQFLRLKLGLALHLRQPITPTNWSPKAFNPYIKVAYNLDFFDYRYRDINGKALGSSLRIGAGAVIKITHRYGIVYEFTHNQRITEDYRTFFQQNIGLVINMDQEWLSR